MVVGRALGKENERERERQGDRAHFRCTRGQVVPSWVLVVWMMTDDVVCDLCDRGTRKT